MKHLFITSALLTVTSTMAVAETGMFRAENDPMAIHASEFIGQRIYTSSDAVEQDSFAGIQDGWENIGEVNDIVLSRDGMIDSVLVDIGGFLGIGERQIAVDMDALKWVSDSATAEDTSDYFLVMQADMADFENAPAYHTDVCRTLDEEVAQAADAVEQTADATGTAIENTAQDLKSGAETAASEVGEAITDTTEQAQNMAADTMAQDGEPILRDEYEPVVDKTLTADLLTGARVYDAKDEWMGEVSELVMNDKQVITHAVVDVGGFLGIGEKPVKLSIDEVQVMTATDGDDVRVYVPMTEEKLKSMPTYEGK